MKKTILSLLSVAGLITLVACATIPENHHAGEIPAGASPDFALLILSDLDSNEQSAAYATGAGTALDTLKIIPDVPEDIKTMIDTDPTSIDFLDPLLRVVGNQIEFDTLVIARPYRTTQTVSILGQTIRESEVVATNAIVFDVKGKRLLAENIYHYSYNEMASLPSITAAGRAAMLNLIGAK